MLLDDTTLSHDSFCITFKIMVEVVSVAKGGVFNSHSLKQFSDFLSFGNSFVEVYARQASCGLNACLEVMHARSLKALNFQ